MPLKNGFIAEIDKQIAESFEGEKLRDIETIKLKQALAYIFQLIGLSKYPDNEEFMIIDEYIRTSYPFFTINELKIAFKLAVQGKLECNCDHYERFSPKYISQILNAYKSKANDVRKQIKPPKPEMPIPQLTDDEIVLFTQNDWLNGKKDDFNKIFNADKVFKILYNQKKLPINGDYIKKIMDIVNNDNLYRINRMNVRDAKEFSKQIKNPDYFDIQCKKLTLVQYFENLPSNI